MLQKFSGAICVFTLLISTNLHAAYLGGGGSLISFDDSVDSVDPKNLSFRIGHEFNPNFSLGGEFGFSLLDDELAGVDFGVDTLLIYLKANLVLENGTKLYALTGVSDLTLTGTVNGISVEFDDSGTAFGVGIQIPAETGGFWYVDYIKYYDEDEFDLFSGDVTVDGLNLGYILHL